MRSGALFLIPLNATGTFGQMNTGELSGNVRDLSSAVLSAATVLANHSETGQTFAAQPNNFGEYLFAQLPVGTYSVVVSAQNFKQYSLARLEIHASDRLRRDFTLQLGEMSEVVTVEADSQALPLGTC
jgi:hypothetical protein